MPIYRANHVVPVSSPPILGGAVCFRQGLIAAVGSARAIIEDFPEEEVLDFGDSAIVPGFVNCHTHLELTAFRGQLDKYDDDFCRWLIEITKLRREYDAADQIELSARLGAAEAASSGVTTIGDIGRVGTAGVAALNAVGLRGIVFQETEFSPSGLTAKEDFRKLVEKFEVLAGSCKSHVAAGLSPHAPYTVSRELFELITGYSIDNDVLMSIHAAESAEEAELMTKGTGAIAELLFKDSSYWKTPHLSTVAYLQEIGVLDAAPLLAHCIGVSAEEVAMIAESGTKIAHCPKSNSKFGHGAAPLGEFLEHGITVGIGTDSMASNNICDMLEEARFAGLISRVRGGQHAIVSPELLFWSMTMGGASALGLECEIGSLEPGKQADLVIISIDGIAQVPVNDIYSTLIFSTSASSVTSVLVGGDVVYKDGKLTQIDAEELVSRVSRTF
ncbi:MAG: amidohydrolase family protein [Acidobacteriota bacterium]|nr:amidohydrolase family protein [Acidobacteriota bacterium]MDH3528234.1 amidohydrolase family protein [Acidobacteriota bacterium]